MNRPFAATRAPGREADRRAPGAEGPPPSPVAIVGMACVFPGARNLQQYWENILAKVSAIGDPPEEWEADLFVDPSVEANDRIYCARGGYLGDLAAFDPIAHGVMPNAVDGGEPDHFLALRAADEALRDAGYPATEIDRTRAEVILGRGSYVNRGNTTAIQHGIVVDQLLRVLKQLHPEHTDEALAALKRALKASLPPFHAETAPALVPNIISGRIANRLDLMGANYIVDAACASSLVAVDLGMRDLRSGRCDVAVVGGVHASTPPVIMMIFCQLKAISRGGAIRPFDRRADGTLLGEGVGTVVLKRLADAERDGDRIYAVLREVGIASDGRALGLLAPRVEGEELALRRAYEGAGIDPGTIGLLEAHGTGTAVGDAVEIEALGRVFGPPTASGRTCALGSVKSMIGHLMPASGVAGLIKAALALHHKVLPPTLNCDEPDPALPLGEGGFYINTETRPWIHPRFEVPRRAAVNAFGFGGINAHAILEEHVGGAETCSLSHRWETEVLILSGSSRDDLLDEIGRVRACLETSRDLLLKDLAFTLNVAAPHATAQATGDRAVRLAVVATDLEDLGKKLARADAALRDPRCTRLRDRNGLYYAEARLGDHGGLAFVFPGEGSQYRNMLADLCLHCPAVRSTFDLMDRAFIDHPRGYRPSDVIFPPPVPSSPDRLWEMDTGAEAVFAANQAMAALLRELQIAPQFMTGHSTGEHSALLASGLVQVDDDEELIRHILGVNASFEQLRSVGEIPGGVLTAVGGVDRALIESLVAQRGGDLYIALDNCPHQVVLCGTEASAAAARQALQAHRAICQPLPFQRAYHTPWFERFCGPLREYFEAVRIGAPDIRVYSCVTAQPYPNAPDAVRTLVATQWARTVRFRDTVEAMYADGARIFVEVGPKANLTSFIEDTLRGRASLAIPSNTAHRSGITELQHLLGQLAAHGVPMNLAPLYDRRDPTRLELTRGHAATATKRSHPVALKTGLQPLRLPPSFTLPDRAPAAPRAAVVGPGTTMVPPQRRTRRRTSTTRQVVVDHLETMEHFLRVQTDVMQAYLARRRSPNATIARSNGAAALVSPFAGEIEKLVPGQRVVATRRITLEGDHWIRDHTLGRDVSAADPDLTALPVVPLTISMEILAEVASHLQPGRRLVGMEAIRAYRWITLEEAQVTLRVTASATDGPPAEPSGGTAPAAVQAAIEVAEGEAGDAGDARGLLVEATLLFAEAYPAPRRAAAFTLADARASAWTPDRLYRDGMFHGPRFRAVRSVNQMGQDGASATLRTLSRATLFADTPHPSFQMDPVLLDAAGQVLAFWAKERLEPGVDVFPYRVGAVRLYGPPPPVGRVMTCHVRAAALGDHQTRCDFALVDEHGHLYCEVDGWEDRRFRLPRALVALQRAPRDSYLSRRSPTNGAGTPLAGEAVCRRVEDLPDTLLLGHGGIWMQVLAHAVLSRRERERWPRSQAPAARCAWLLEQVAAKDAVRQLVRDRHGLELHPADVELLTDEAGRPAVQGSWLAALGRAPRVAIAQAPGTVEAVAAFDLEAVL